MLSRIEAALQLRASYTTYVQWLRDVVSGFGGDDGRPTVVHKCTYFDNVLGAWECATLCRPVCPKLYVLRATIPIRQGNPLV